MFRFADVVEFLVGLEGSGCESANLCNLRPLAVGWVRAQRRTKCFVPSFRLVKLLKLFAVSN